MYTDIRNADGKLICRIYESTDGIVLEIKTKKCVSLIHWSPGGKPQVTNSKKPA